MADHQTARNEKATRAPLWPGTLMALVALIGVDCAMAGRTAAERGHKSAAIAVRAMAPAAMAARATTAKLVLAGAGLVVLLLLSRQISWLAQRPTTALVTALASGPRPPTPRRKTSITYHTGGLYGP